MKYTILYKNTKIGVLEINDKGMHRYTPDEEGIESIKDEVALMKFMLEKTDWKETIPFFKIRIDAAKRFNQDDDIVMHTDSFRMVKI